MPWTERQRAMLGEIGIRLWSSPRPGAAEVVPVVPPPAVPVAPEAPSLVEPVTAPSPVAPVMAAALAPSPVAPPARSAGLVTAAPTGAVSAMDWPELKATVEACRACGLCESRRQTVFGVGNPQAHWMLVGEAPGEQEDLQGEPFVGKAGQLLDNMLRAVGLTREQAEPARQVYIANVLKCRPPGNRNPDPQEVQRCEPYLQRQVELVRPRLILAMGRFAVQSLLKTAEPIGRLRGKPHHYHGVPVVVTYHPAYLLRNPLDKARAWEDLCLARELMQAATP
jgi:uracil-DNA glycosylase